MLEISYPNNLPVSREILRIKELVIKHQVVIVSGDTGSGKTTQLPKMLFEMGYAEFGIIGHTQPRRVAAKAIAKRIGEELGSHQLVAYKVRFSDKTQAHTKIKLMTDGILLQEIQKDRLLKQYSALIIDEAHERSLNIDFILGYLKNILIRRPELKVLITSATIENEKFSKFFSLTTHVRDSMPSPTLARLGVRQQAGILKIEEYAAPVISVVGNSYPIDIVYQPPSHQSNKEEADLNNLVYNALLSCIEMEPGNILVFMPGEREIKDCIGFLRRVKLRHYQILALFARQNEVEQNLVFVDDGLLKIIISTNIAETSVTIPGVKYVIDSGLARIKRYNSRTNVEQLQVEKISQASIFQRSGRCGRVSNGICVRLYSEEDFQLRAKYTKPEILRSNLANVILRLLSFGLGDPLSFPFLDMPDNKAFTDGFKTLYQLMAIDKHNQISVLGRKLALIPIDVNLARILWASAFEFDCLDEMLVIVSFLTIVDPREYPLDMQTKIREVHKLWQNKDSDFIAILNLWDWYKDELLHKKSRRKLAECLHGHFLNVARMREWQELHGQLKEVMHNLGANIIVQPKSADSIVKYQHIHQALLTGLLHNIGQKDLIENHYSGAQGKKFFLHPSSNITSPKWLCSAGLVQTNRLYARLNAQIMPEWIVPVSQHLVKYTHSDERFDSKRGEVVVTEHTLLYGLIINRKSVLFAKINLSLAHEIFIHQALIVGVNKLPKDYSFIKHNQNVINEIDKVESKYRSLLIDIEEELFKFYLQVLPIDICDIRTFDIWCKVYGNNLKLDLATFLQQIIPYEESLALYPDFIVAGTQKIRLKYIFDTSRDEDGVNAYVNLEELWMIDEKMFSWLVPGIIRDKITYIVKNLAKQIRVNLNPVANFVTAFLEQADIEKDFNQELSRYINTISPVALSLKWQDIEQIELPPYLKVHFNILDNKKIIYKSDSVLKAKNELAGKLNKIVNQFSNEYEISNVTKWLPQFSHLLSPKSFLLNGKKITGFYALVIKNDSINYVLVDNLLKATIFTKKSLLRLIKLQLVVQLKFLRQKQFSNFKLTALYLGDVYAQKDLFLEDVIDYLIRISAKIQDIPHTEDEFANLVNVTRSALADSINNFAILIYKIALNYNQVKQSIKDHPLNLSILSQLDDLIFPQFLRFITFEHLKHYPRYLEAILYRLNKYQINSARDKMLESEVEYIYNTWYNHVDELERQHKPISREIYDFKFKIEELRVSLFAQELKAAYTVSAKRLWRELEALKN